MARETVSRVLLTYLMVAYAFMADWIIAVLAKLGTVGLMEKAAELSSGVSYEFEILQSLFLLI